jgi:hypothetical protein
MMTVTLALRNLREAIEILKREPRTKERDEVLKQLEDALQELQDIWRRV